MATLDLMDPQIRPVGVVYATPGKYAARHWKGTPVLKKEVKI